MPKPPPVKVALAVVLVMAAAATPDGGEQVGGSVAQMVNEPVASNEL